VTTPDPGAVLLVVLDHGQRLRIVDDDQVVGLQVVPDGVFVNDLFVDLHLPVAQVDRVPLEGVVHLLGNAEKIRRSLDDPPPGLDPHAVHEKAHGGKELRHPAPVIGRVDVYHMKVLKRFGLIVNPSDRLRPYKLFVVLQPNLFFNHDSLPLGYRSLPPDLMKARFRATWNPAS